MLKYRGRAGRMLGTVLSVVVLLVAIIVPSVALAEEGVWLDASVVYERYSFGWVWDTDPEPIADLGDVWRVDMDVFVHLMQEGAHCDIHFEFETFSTYFRFINTGRVDHGAVQIIPVQGGAESRSWDVVFGRQLGAYRLWIDGQELVSMDEPEEQLQRVRIKAIYKGSVSMKGYHDRHRAGPTSLITMLSPAHLADIVPGTDIVFQLEPFEVGGFYSERFAVRATVNGYPLTLVGQLPGVGYGLWGNWYFWDRLENVTIVASAWRVPWEVLGEWNRVDWMIVHLGERRHGGGVWYHVPTYHFRSGWFRWPAGSPGEWDGDIILHPGVGGEGWLPPVPPDGSVTGWDGAMLWIAYAFEWVTYTITAPLKALTDGVAKVGKAISDTVETATQMLSGLGGIIAVLWSVFPPALTSVMVAGLALVVAMRVLGR